MDKDEFYIGWQDDATSSYKQGRSKFFVVSLLIILLFGTGYLFVENKFVDSYFDYGNLTSLQGTIVEYPVFGIRTEIDGKKITVPLVGFGKFDALPVLKTIKEQSHSVPLEDLKISLRGTLFKYQEKTWMELTEGDGSIVSIETTEDKYVQTTRTIGLKTIAGEIVDPKCFFGVMNPANKKIHRSCAIRCISGGIPPILAIRENGIFVDYYFVTNENGQPVNMEVLQFVGIPLSLSGEVQQIDDWKVVRINTKKISQTIHAVLDRSLAFCN